MSWTEHVSISDLKPHTPVPPEQRSMYHSGIELNLLSFDKNLHSLFSSDFILVHTCGFLLPPEIVSEGIVFGFICFLWLSGFYHKNGLTDLNQIFTKGR